MRRRPIGPETIVVGLGMAIGLSFGLSYGDGSSNQPAYLLAGLRRARPDFLAHDWFATEIFVPHYTFGWIVAALETLGILAWSLAIANVLAVAAVCVVAFRILSHALDRYRLAGWAVFAMLFFGIQRAEALEGSVYFFTSGLEPSTIATVAMVVAAYAFIRERFMLSGALLAISGIFHSNYLLLGILYFGAAHLLLGKDRLHRRLLEQFILCLPVFAVEAPAMLEVASHGQRDAARQILFDVVLPFHYAPGRQWVNLVEFLGFQLVVVGALLGARPAAHWRPLGALHASFLMIVVGTIAVSMIAPHSALTQLYPWRVAPFANFLGSIIIAASAVRLLTSVPREALSQPWAAALAWTGALAFLRLAMYFGVTVRPRYVVQAVLFGVFGLMLWHLPRWLARADARRLRWALYVAAAVIVAAGAVRHAQPGRFNLVWRDANDPERSLYRWARTTTPESQFLVPPVLPSFRLSAERPIVADWQANPILPDELLSWYGRLEDVSGRPGFGSRAELVDGYNQMTWDRLRELDERYRLDYAVFDVPFDPAPFAAPIAYRNRRFIVLDLRGG